ncbi:MAG: hypothetical protein M3O15_15580 [Acidobacteriota bacterium]|nr:hypothetical protein [Acidobacteriota bacterium]
MSSKMIGLGSALLLAVALSRPAAAATAAASTLGSLTPLAPHAASTVKRDLVRKSSGCVTDDFTACLVGGRFEVTATYLAADGASGNAHSVALTDDTGYLWFFGPLNVEVVVKVLNACGVNNHFWVFAGGLTNVNVVLTVVDTETGTGVSYENPINTPYLPVQDTAALMTCP